MVLLATKCDMEYDRQVLRSGECNTLSNNSEIYEVVTQEEHAYAKKLNVLHFDTSAKLGINVHTAVEELVRLIRVSSIKYSSYIYSIHGFEQQHEMKFSEQSPLKSRGRSKSGCGCIIL
jgi:GTPase SAR1 family protein